MNRNPDGFQQESNRTAAGFPVRENMCARLRDQRPENNALLPHRMNLHLPRATRRPVDNPPSGVLAMRCEEVDDAHTA